MKVSEEVVPTKTLKIFHITEGNAKDNMLEADRT